MKLKKSRIVVNGFFSFKGRDKKFKNDSWRRNWGRNIKNAVLVGFSHFWGFSTFFDTFRGFLSQTPKNSTFLKTRKKGIFGSSSTRKVVRPRLVEGLRRGGGGGYSGFDKRGGVEKHPFFWPFLGGWGVAYWGFFGGFFWCFFLCFVRILIFRVFLFGGGVFSLSRGLRVGSFLHMSLTLKFLTDQAICTIRRSMSI